MIANGRGAPVKVMRVGLDGTDREIIGSRRQCSPGDDYLIFSHESLGVVEEAGHKCR